MKTFYFKLVFKFRMNVIYFDKNSCLYRNHSQITGCENKIACFPYC